MTRLPPDDPSLAGTRVLERVTGTELRFISYLVDEYAAKLGVLKTVLIAQDGVRIEEPMDAAMHNLACTILICSVVCIQPTFYQITRNEG